jgi:hypothetical protein
VKEKKTREILGAQNKNGAGNNGLKYDKARQRERKI